MREYGYTSTTDNMYPSRADGIEEKAMSIPLFLNENLSRNDAVLFPTMNTTATTETINRYRIGNAAECLHKPKGQGYRRNVL